MALFDDAPSLRIEIKLLDSAEQRCKFGI